MTLSGIVSLLLGLHAISSIVGIDAVEVSNLSVDESDYFLIADARDGVATCTPGKTTGIVSLKPAFVASIKSKAGLAPFHERASVQTTFLSSSSVRHVDKLPFNEEGIRPPVPKGEQVGFVPLETNDDAYFDVDNECIPIREGNLVQFDGHLPHHTVVNSGSVSLLGPFHTKTMHNVGDCTSPVSDPAYTWSLEDAGGNDAGVLVLHQQETLYLRLDCFPGGFVAGQSYGISRVDFNFEICYDPPGTFDVDSVVALNGWSLASTGDLSYALTAPNECTDSPGIVAEIRVTPTSFNTLCNVVVVVAGIQATHDCSVPTVSYPEEGEKYYRLSENGDLPGRDIDCSGICWSDVCPLTPPGSSSSSSEDTTSTSSSDD